MGMEKQPRSEPWAIVFHQPGCVLMVVRAQRALVAMCRVRQGWHDLEAEKTPQSLSVIPRAARAGINPKITPPDVPGVCLSPVIQDGEISPWMSLLPDGEIEDHKRADPGQVPAAPLK